MKDAEVLDAAISAIETLHWNLWAWRAMVKELGDVRAQYDSTKASLEVIKQQTDQLSVQLEAARAEFPTVQQQTVEAQKRNAELDREIEHKVQMLKQYSTAIDRITGAAA